MTTSDMGMKEGWHDLCTWAGINGDMNECPLSFNIPDKTVLEELEKFYAQHSGNRNFPAEQYMLLLTGVASRLPNETPMGWAMDLVSANSEEDIFKMLPGLSEEQQAALQTALTLYQERIDAADEARAARVAAADAAEAAAAVRAEVEAAVAAADEAEAAAAVRAEVEAAVHAADEADRVAAFDLMYSEHWNVEEVESPLKLRRGRFIH
jgi:hypothetical protein